MMRDKLIEALTTEYDAVYLIDLAADTYEALKGLEGSDAMRSSNCWSVAGKAFAKECSTDSREIVRLFSDPQFLRVTLAKTDHQDCTFLHTISDARWRKASVQVIERNETVPTLVLMMVSVIDNLAYQKEKMIQKALSAKQRYEKTWYGDGRDRPAYKTMLSDAEETEDNKLFDGINILLVEDNEILRLISRETLENEGAVVTEAENGQQAVDMVIGGTRFDFIIMDIVMPVLDGIEATRRITEYQKTQGMNIPILGLTADGTDAQVKEIMNAGGYACLSKPLNPKEMSKVFISCMKEKAMLMEEKMAEMYLLANTDMLTQTGNIVAYTQDISDLSRTMYDSKQDVAIVMCDLDNLKGINDTYGHDVGDIYIKNCCALITDTFRESSLYRVGGDEFAIIVKGDELARLDDYIKILNEKSREFSSVKEVINGKASVSAGYAIYDETIDQSLSDTMKRADMAMYENKQIHKKWTRTYARLK